MFNNSDNFLIVSNSKVQFNLHFIHLFRLQNLVGNFDAD